MANDYVDERAMDAFISCNGHTLLHESFIRVLLLLILLFLFYAQYTSPQHNEIVIIQMHPKTNRHTQYLRLED